MNDLPVCRAYPHEVLDGPNNMARDEALLELVASAGTFAAIRTYGWSEPTLSLGYFQSVHDVAANPRWDRLAKVRRATGGGAILHHHDLTFALIVPSSHPLARRSGPLYRSTHKAVAELLEEHGILVGRRGEPECPKGERDRPFLCFEDTDPEDLVLGSSKLVGSAQRRRAGAVLQHGSLLLARSEFTAELPGIAELVVGVEGLGALAPLLRAEVPTRLGFRTEDHPWPAAVIARSEQLALEVYGDRNWTDRR